jgi:Putative zinc-finger
MNWSRVELPECDFFVMIGLDDRMDCDRDLIAAYLDGELNGKALEEFEAHLQRCCACRSELTNQQQLLCTLEAAFRHGFELPNEFARIVKARAEGEMRGIREKGERRTALQLIIILALASLALLGAAWQGSIVQPLRSLARVILSILELSWRTIYDAGTGLAIIGRLAGQTINFNPRRMAFLSLIVLLAGISLLPRLIAKYHRAQTIE